MKKPGMKIGVSLSQPSRTASQPCPVLRFNRPFPYSENPRDRTSRCYSTPSRSFARTASGSEFSSHPDIVACAEPRPALSLPASPIERGVPALSSVLGLGLARVRHFLFLTKLLHIPVYEFRTLLRPR
jgi:hypothetical protein